MSENKCSFHEDFVCFLESCQKWPKHYASGVTIFTEFVRQNFLHACILYGYGPVIFNWGSLE